MKILMVDDRPSNLVALGAALDAPDYELVKAGSGEDALRFLLRDSCALILMDVDMPGMDGYETARLIRSSERTRDIPIVFITGLDRDRRRVLAGYESGAVDYLFKPVDPDVLRSKVSAFVALHLARQQVVAQAEALRQHERRAHQLELAELELQGLRREEAAQRRYRALVEGISHAIVWTLDPVSLTCTFVSPSAEALLGFPLERWVAEPGFWEGRLHPEDRAGFRAAVAGLVPGAPGFTVEHRLLRADGQLAWFETAIGLLPGGDGRALELHGYSVDVTRAVEGRASLAFVARASAALAEGLDRRATALAAARVAVSALGDLCVVDLAASDAAPAETFVAHARPGLEESARAFAAAGPVRALRHEGEGRRTVPIELPAGAPGARALGLGAALVVPLAARGHRLGALTLFAAEPARFSGNVVALANELGRRAAQALDHALLYEEARAAVALREEFLSVASHELRTPLSALLMQTHLLRKLVGGGSGKELAGGELLARVEKQLGQVNRITALVNSLFDLVRIRTGTVRMTPEPCDLAAIARDVRSRFEEVAARGARTVVVDAAEAVTGTWDPGRLDQVATNLVANALRYGRGEVRLEVRRDGPHAVLAVTDAGPGIPAEEQARIFDRFERGGRRDGEGLGLGLYICRKVAEAHGGTIELDSEVGRGTTFTVRLPLAAAMAASQDAPSRTPERLASA